MSLHDTLDELVALIEGARSMPMSTSCVVNRAEVLALLDEIRGHLPDELDAAEEVLRRRDAVVEGGRAEAEQILAEAHEERMRLVSQTEVLLQAEREASRVLSEATDDAMRRRAEADSYVDGKLANFEITLNKTLVVVERGRDRLRAEHAHEEERRQAEARPLPGA